MADKEIIINGFNVKSCEYFRWFDSRCSLINCQYGGGHPSCENIPNCQYKRLMEQFDNKTKKYKQALDSIVATIKDLENEDIVTFPDFSLKENCKIIMGQCNKGYVDILNIIKKAKDDNDDI